MSAQSLKLIDKYPHAKPFFYKGNDEIAIFVHGFTGTPAELKDLAKSVRKELGWTCKGILLPGHGTYLSDLSRSKSEDWTAMLEYELNQARENYRVIHLIGLSMGANLCILGAKKFPEKVSSLVLINSAIFLSPSLKARLFGFLKIFEFFLPNFFAKKARSSRELSSPHVSYEGYPFKSLIEFDKICQQVQMIDKLKVKKCLIATSLQDQTIDPKSAQTIHRIVKAKLIKNLELKDSDHVATLDREKATLEKEVLRFLKRPIA